MQTNQSPSDHPAMAIVIMGVSGSGKSTVGRALSRRTSISFIDGDDIHSDENIAMMARGVALTDSDREPWLDRLSEVISEHIGGGRSVIIACSALKRAYRDRLRQAARRFIFVYLKGDYQLISERMRDRQEHFMKQEMLKSQLETLEEPVDALTINADQESERIVDEIISRVLQ